MKRNIYGPLTQHAVGFILRSLMRKAIEIIRAERFVLEVEGKMGYSGKMDDVVSSGDKKAQKLYEHYLRECLPLLGNVGEENDLKTRCRVKGNNIWISIDPVDGTKAYVRMQSFGVATMIALVVNSKVVSAYIGDTNTGEMYGFRPGSRKMHRIIGDGIPHQQLVINPNKTLLEQYVLLRDSPYEYSPLVQEMVVPPRMAGMFKNMEVNGGSIGITFTRLWKGECGAAILQPTKNTPWDATPIVGISLHMGFRFFRIKPSMRELVPYEPRISSTTTYESYETLVIHKSRVKELAAWCAKRGVKLHRNIER